MSCSWHIVPELICLFRLMLSMELFNSLLIFFVLLELFFFFIFLVCQFFPLSFSASKIITWSYLSFSYCISLFGQLLTFYFVPFITSCIWHLFENHNKIQLKKDKKKNHEALTTVYKYWVQFETLSKQPIQKLLEFVTCSLRLRRWSIKNKIYHNVYNARMVGLAFGSVFQGQEPRTNKVDLLRCLYLVVGLCNGRNQPKNEYLARRSCWHWVWE